MRMLFIMCEANVDPRIIELLLEAGVTGYTRFTDAFGSGSHGRREGSPVWPGLNSVILACVQEEMVEPIRAAVSALQDERGGRLAVRLFSSQAQQLV